jgi:hypothetical protein
VWWCYVAVFFVLDAMKKVVDLALSGRSTWCVVVSGAFLGLSGWTIEVNLFWARADLFDKHLAR